MRWWPNALEESFPNTFHVCGSNPPLTPNLFFDSDEKCSATFTELYVWPVAVYVVLWAAPYYIFFFIIGKAVLRKGGYFTMFDDMIKKPAIAKVLKYGGEWGKEFKYMCCHGALCYLAFLLGPLLWHSFILHTLYLMLVIMVAVYNGATFYFRVFTKRRYMRMMKQAAREREAMEPEEEEQNDFQLAIQPSSESLAAVEESDEDEGGGDSGSREGEGHISTLKGPLF